MKRILILGVISLLAFSACSAEKEELVSDSSTVEEAEATESGLITESLYTNDTYGFQLTFPETWLPVTELLEDGADGALAEIWLVGGEEAIQIGNVPLFLRSIEIGVYPIAEKEAQMANRFGLYNKYLGENANYAFFYEAELLYMYPSPSGCKNIESTEKEALCAKYKPAYEDTQQLTTTFVAL